jgi:hypothetical protein
MTWQETQTLIVAIFELIQEIMTGPIGKILREEL